MPVRNLSGDVHLAVGNRSGVQRSSLGCGHKFGVVSEWMIFKTRRPDAIP